MKEERGYVCALQISEHFGHGTPWTCPTIGHNLQWARFILKVMEDETSIRVAALQTSGSSPYAARGLLM